MTKKFYLQTFEKCPRSFHFSLLLKTLRRVGIFHLVKNRLAFNKVFLIFDGMVLKSVKKMISIVLMVDIVWKKFT